MKEPVPAHEVRVAAAHEVARLATIEFADSVSTMLFALLWLLVECGFLLVRLLFVRPQGDA